MSGNQRQPEHFHSSRSWVRVCLVLTLLFGLPGLSGAAEVRPATEGAQVSLDSTSRINPLFAGWLSKFTSGLATRSNVVRISIAVMALALFIMMKKFDGGEPGQIQGKRQKAKGKR